MADLSGKRQTAMDQLGLAPIRLRHVAVEALAPCVRFSLRGSDAVAAGSAFGVELPRQACRANLIGTRAVLWLGPDEWLLIDSDPAADAQALAANLEAALAAPHSLVDISHRNAGLSVSGRQAATALNAACLLDLSIEAFPVGMCTRTIFGKAEIVLWRTEELTFRIEVWRSFVGYVAGLLDVACQDAATLERTR